MRLSQFQERTVEDFARKVEEIYKQDPNFKGWCWTCATTRVVCSMRLWRYRRPFCPKT
jgi:hypothetical protein